MVDGTRRELDIPALARRYGRELAAEAHVVLESREAAEAAAALGIADVLRGRQAMTLPEDAGTASALSAATLRRAAMAERSWREVEPRPDADAPSLRSFTVSAEAVTAALAAPAAADRKRPRLAVAIAAVLLLALGAIGFWQIPANAADGVPPPKGVMPSLRAADTGPAGPIAAVAGPASGRVTLAGCGIEPSSTPVAYRGWLTLGDLTPTTNEVLAAQPLFALVTAGEAEWLGWHTRGSGAMYPHPIGRVACAMDPFTETTHVYAVPGDWQAPVLPDGCPPGDIHNYGDLREIGGPRLFATLPIGTGSWRARDPSLRLYLRLADPPNVDATVAATARSLEANVQLPLTVARVNASPTTTPVQNLYIALADVRLPNPGCWVVSVALDGQVVGRTLVPVAAAAGPLLLGR